MSDSQRQARAMDEATRRLYAVGCLIEKLRRAAPVSPVRGPELRSLAEIVAAADAAGERVVVLAGEGRIHRGGPDAGASDGGPIGKRPYEFSF